MVCTVTKNSLSLSLQFQPKCQPSRKIYQQNAGRSFVITMRMTERTPLPQTPPYRSTLLATKRALLARGGAACHPAPLPDQRQACLLIDLLQLPGCSSGETWRSCDTWMPCGRLQCLDLREQPRLPIQSHQVGL